MADTEMMVVSQEATALQLFAPGMVDQILIKVKEKARAEAKDLDISTIKGRNSIAALAYKVAKTKTFMDAQGKALVEGEKRRLAVIDGERKKLRDELDALKDEVRKPLDDYEATEAARVKALEDGVASFSLLYEFEFPPTADQIADRLKRARETDISTYQEFSRRAIEAQKRAITILEPMLAGARAKEAEEAAEAVRKIEEEIRVRKEREAAIASAAKAQAEEVAKFKAEKAERAAKAEQERIEREAQQRLERVEKEAAEREAAIERERQAAVDRAARAERDRLESEARSKREAQEQTRRAEEEKQTAVRAEQKRQEDALNTEKEALRKREANRDHVAKINGEAEDAILKAVSTMGKVHAVAVIGAIARGLIAHVRIEY